MVFGVHLQAGWFIPKPWSWLNRYHNYDCRTGQKSSMYNSKAHLHKESINFPSLGVICGKGRRKRKKNISLKLSELRNFYHLQCTFLLPCTPLNVKWQGWTQGPAAILPEWQSGERAVLSRERRLRGGTFLLAGPALGTEVEPRPPRDWCPAAPSVPEPSMEGCPCLKLWLLLRIYCAARFPKCPPPCLMFDQRQEIIAHHSNLL